jgi:hypothetical protein
MLPATAYQAGERFLWEGGAGGSRMDEHKERGEPSLMHDVGGCVSGRAKHTSKRALMVVIVHALARRVSTDRS